MTQISFRQWVSAAVQARENEALLVGEEGVIIHSPGLFSKQRPKDHERAWQAFRRAVVETYGEERARLLYAESNVNIDREEQAGRPLCKRHIEQICIASEHVRASDIEKLSRARAAWLPLEAIRSVVQRLVPYRYPIGLEAELLDGGPSEFGAHFFRNQRLMNKERVVLLRTLAQLSPYSFIERMTKTLANRELTPGLVLPAPGLDGKQDFYVVHEKICQEGLVAYALKPLSKFSYLKPLIVFRPTQFSLQGEDAPQSWLNDLDTRIGHRGYLAAKSDFARLMADPSFCAEGEKVEIAGYSLGGSHAQLFLKDHWKQVSKASFFNDPSVDSKTAEAFAEEINRSPVTGKQELSLVLYRTKGDIAHCIGEKHIGWGVHHPGVNIEIIELDSVEKKIFSRGYLHALRFFDNTRQRFVAALYGAHESHHHLDNALRGPEVKYWEPRRLRGRWLVLSFVWTLHQINSWIHKQFGSSLFRYTR